MATPDFTTLCRLVRRNHFFIIHVVQHTVITRYGKGTGKGGRETKNTFRTHTEALKAATDIYGSKTADGYKISLDNETPQQVQAPTNPNPSTSPTLRRSSRKRTRPQAYNPAVPSAKRSRTSPTSRSRATAKSAKPVHVTQPRTSAAGKRQRRGLRGTAVLDTTSNLGVVDPASGIDGFIVSVIEVPSYDPVIYDVMLVLVDIAKNHDKFIVLQLICDQQNGKFFLYERYGRTGTAGQSLTIEHPSSTGLFGSLTEFERKFKQKTGLDWAKREDPPVPGKYRFVKQNFQAKRDAATSDQPIWQYWVDDGVDGKPNGWYNYDQNGNALVEQLYLEYNNNAWLTQRIVQSGVYAYLVDLESLTQQNVIHSNHTIRNIRRVPPNEIPGENGPTDGFPDIAVNNPNNVQVMTMRVTKPTPRVPVAQPSHKVKPAPPAILPTSTKAPQKAAKLEETEHSKENKEVLEIPVDDNCPKSSEYHVVGDWDATMNQSNIMDGSNNNKYYRIQLLKHDQKGSYHVWTRWGRVGESRGTQTKLLGPYTELEQAEKSFGKKFRDKTANSWDQRKNFKPVQGRYELLEMDHSAKKEEDSEALVTKIRTQDKIVEYLPSKLRKETKELVELLFQKDVYTNAMKEFDIDIRRMPLGKLSTEQIEKGVAVLEEIEEALSGTPVGTSSELERLSSKFYTTLPHDFGRQRPPVISDMTMLQRLYDMCNVLKDMEKATNLMSEADEKSAKQKEKKKVPHPADTQYASLNAGLGLLDPASEEHKMVSAAYHNTLGGFKSQLLNIWRVDRKGEAERFRAIDVSNHMLLWHGSHIGAISAILATGLRIMPHSGGRVGRGIYLASENGKSQHYTTPALHNKTGCMFFVQAALGKTRDIFDDDSSLLRAPDGYHSVRACGRQTPKGFCKLDLGGVPVSVPVEAPGPNKRAQKSSFMQDEYLIYNEAQARIRYVITVKK